MSREERRRVRNLVQAAQSELYYHLIGRGKTTRQAQREMVVRGMEWSALLDNLPVIPMGPARRGGKPTIIIPSDFVHKRRSRRKLHSGR